MLLRFLREVDLLHSPNIAKKEIGRTLANIPVPLLIITNQQPAKTVNQHSHHIGMFGTSFGAGGVARPGSGEDSSDTDPTTSQILAALKKGDENPPKKHCVVIARQHPGEVVGSWAVQGLIKFLLGNSSLANALRSTHIFHIVPMVNVDGVVYVGQEVADKTLRIPSKIMSNPSSLPSSTGDGERFTDCTRRQLNLDSRRGGYLLRVLLYLLPLLSARFYEIFRLVADGARHRGRVTTMLFRLCF